MDPERECSMGAEQLGDLQAEVTNGIGAEPLVIKKSAVPC